MVFREGKYGDGASAAPGGGEPVEWVVDLRGKVLYLGSCASLGVQRRRIAELRKETGAVAICGYTRFVDWYEPAGFEIMFLSALAAAADGERKSVGSAIKRMRRRAGGSLRQLGVYLRA